MFSNPLFNANTNDNPNNISAFSDQKDMIGDLTDQSLDTSNISNIEDTYPMQKGFSNPFHDKLDKSATKEKLNVPKEETKTPVLQDVREESQPRPSVKELMKNFQFKKAEQPEEKPQPAATEGRGSVKNLISKFEKKPATQEEPPSPTNVMNLEARGSVASMIKNIERKVSENENKISGPEMRQLDTQMERGYQNEAVPIQETHEKHEQSGLGLDDYSQDLSYVEEGNASGNKIAGGFSNPLKDAMMKADKSLLEQSQDLSYVEEGNTSTNKIGFSNPYKEAMLKNDKSLLEQSQDMSYVDEANTSTNKIGFSNPYKDAMLKADKSLLDQSQELPQDKPRQTAQFGESGLVQNQGFQFGQNQGNQFGQNEYLHQGDMSQMEESGLLDDMTVDDESLNVSGFKPMMNNPLGLNRSYMDNNKSQLDVSRSKLNYSNISQMGNKLQAGSEQQGEGLGGMQFNFDTNIDYAQGNMDLRFHQLDEHMLSQLTDDTQDLSHMTVPGFKNVFYGKDNSYYLNMSALDQSAISNLNRSQMQARAGDKSVNKSHNKSAISHTGKLTKPEEAKHENLLDELHAPQANMMPSQFEPRPTAAFGEEPPKYLGAEQKQDLSRHEETDENVPRPTGQFGFKASTIEEPKAQEITIERERQNLEQNKAQIMKEHHEHHEAEDKEHEENKHLDTSQIGDHKDHFKFSQLDISKISVFDTTQDNDDFNPNVTVNNMRAFLSTSHSRLGGLTSPKNKEHLEYDGDLTLEFHQEITGNQHINKKISLALNEDQPKISEVSVAKEETQIMEESRDPYKRAQSAEKFYSSGQKDASFEKEGPTSKSFNDKVANSSFVAPAEGKNKSVDEAKPGYDNYTNPFVPLKHEEIYENRLTVGNLPAAVNPVPVSEEYQNRQPSQFAGLNKSYDTMKTTYESTSAHLNKSYQNVPANVQFDDRNKFTSNIQASSTQSQQNPELQGQVDPNEELVKEGNEIVNRMKNVYNDWKVKNEQFDGYLEEIKRMTFQTPVEQIKIDRSFDTTLKSSKENDRLHHSFDGNQLKPPQVLHHDMSHPSSYYRQDLLGDEKSFSELNVSQDPASQFKKFSNPNFMKPSEEAQPQEEAGSLGQRDPRADSANAINRIFEGFTLGGSKRPLNDEQQKANQSFDMYRTDQAAKEYMNKSYSDFTMKGEILKPAEQIKMETSSDNKSKSETETPNFGDIQGSTGLVGKDVLEGAPVEQYFKEEKSINESLDLSKAKIGVDLIIPSTEKLRINLPLKLKQQKRGRPQILDPKPTTDVPAEAVVDFVVTKKEEKKGTAPIPYYFERTNQRRFFGFKVKKQSFVREKNQRKINAEMEIVCGSCTQAIPFEQFESHSITCNQTSIPRDEVEGSLVFEDVSELNRKLGEIKSKLISNLSLSQDSFLSTRIDELTVIIDTVIAESVNIATIQQTIERVSQLLKESINNAGCSALLNRILILSKAKHSKLALSYADRYEISRLIQENLNYEKEALVQKPINDQIGYQVECLHEVKLEGEQTPRYIKSSYRTENELLIEIDSDIGCSDDEDGQSTVSSIKSIRPLQAGRSGHRTSSESGKKDNSKIKFYSIAVNYRLDLPPEHPNKNIAIADLYNECMEQNIPEAEWNGYLKKKIVA